MAFVFFLGACGPAPVEVPKAAAPVQQDPCFGQEVCMVYEDKPRERKEHPAPVTSTIEAHRNGVKYAPKRLRKD